MISKVQQSPVSNYNNKISFEAAKFKFARGQAQKFQTYMQENAVNKLSQIDPEKVGLLPQFINKKGEFNIKKFGTQMRQAFDDVKSLTGTYILAGLGKTKGGVVKAKLIHLGEDGKEIKGDKFLFNPTHLFKKTAKNATDLDTMDLLSNMQDWGRGTYFHPAIRKQYGKDLWA